MQGEIQSQHKLQAASYVQGYRGYEGLTSLWVALVSGKVTEALVETACCSRREVPPDLTTDQVLLLSLVYSLSRKDAAACFALAEISAAAVPLRRPELRAWLRDGYAFSCREVRTALGFAADLASAGLAFPQLVLDLLESLYSLYCTRRTVNKPAGAEPESQPQRPVSSESVDLLNGPSDSPASPVAERMQTPVQDAPASRCRETDLVADSSSDAVEVVDEKTGDTALHLAVAREDLRAVADLIRRGADVNAVNKDDVTPLQVAVERENGVIVRTLHKAGADVNWKNKKKESLLHSAAASAGLETIDLLIELGADLDSLDDRLQSPLFRATKKGYLVVMEHLVGSGAEVSARDGMGRSLLHYAAWHGQSEAVDWLVGRGLHVDARTKHGWTPLHWAVANRQTATAQVLLRHGADVLAKDATGRTPMYWATQAGNLALMDLLGSYGGTC